MHPFEARSSLAYHHEVAQRHRRILHRLSEAAKLAESGSARRSVDSSSVDSNIIVNEVEIEERTSLSLKTNTTSSTRRSTSVSSTNSSMPSITSGSSFDERRPGYLSEFTSYSRPSTAGSAFRVPAVDAEEVLAIHTLQSSPQSSKRRQGLDLDRDLVATETRQRASDSYCSLARSAGRTVEWLTCLEILTGERDDLLPELLHFGPE
jgi:hypothetical protein